MDTDGPFTSGAAVALPQHLRNHVLLWPTIVLMVQRQRAPKHAAKLRMIALLVGGAVPVVAFAAAALMTGPAMMIACLLGLTGLCIGVLLERWLFFAEAQHAAMFYYGAKAV